MSTAGWVIPVASLSAICVFALGFFFWWFPRTWKKGTQHEMKILAAQLAEDRRAIKRRELDGGETAEGAEDFDELKQPPKAFVYTPPAYATY